MKSKRTSSFFRASLWTSFFGNKIRVKSQFASFIFFVSLSCLFPKHPSVSSLPCLPLLSLSLFLSFLSSYFLVLSRSFSFGIIISVFLPLLVVVILYNNHQ